MILVALGVGLGETFLWPRLVIVFGPNIRWMFLVGVALQTVVMLEMARYAMATGESIFFGAALGNVLFIMLIVLAAKTAIAEPFYVPSGSMEPTLLIGDELLAMKYPYGYSSASLPSFFVFPNTQRVFSALPKRGDVVVFRWPGDRSQVWVKRVIGLPGDRIGVSHGQVRIDGDRGWQHGCRRAFHRDAARRTRASDLQDDRTRGVRRHAGRGRAARPSLRHGR
jgi:signal peptidase I